MIAEYLRVAGVRMAYQEAGEGPAVIMLHGNFASKRWYHEQLRHLPDSYHKVALDLPNFGDSDPLPGGISLGAYADFLGAFIKELLGEKPFILLGHSLGGLVAQIYAARQPATLRGLVLIASAAPSGLKTPQENYQFLDLFRHNRGLLAQSLSATMPSGQPPYFSALVGDALRMHSAAFTGNARAIEPQQMPSGLGEKLAQLDIPALVLRGDFDTIISEAMARETAAVFRQADLRLLINVGHSPQLEDPRLFNQLLLTFLQDIL